MKNLYNRPAGEEMHPPLVPYGTTFPPLRGGTITRAYCRAAYEVRLLGVLFCPLNRGGKGTRFVREQSDLRIV